MNSDQIKQLHIPQEQKRRSRGSIVFIFIVVCLLTAVALYLANPSGAEGPRVMGGNKKTSSSATNTNGPVQPAKVADKIPTSNAGALLTVSGYIINRERIEISPRFMGLVKWIGVNKGDMVTNGQVVVLLDDAEQQARVTEAGGRLASSKANVAKAELDYRRIGTLATNRVESQQALDDARIRLESARAVVQEVQGQLDLVSTYLKWTVITSPINGVVLEKIAKAGELVMPQSFGGARGPSTALIALADPNDLQVEIDINEADLPKIFLHQKCRISPEAYPDKSYDGYVAEMAPEANRQKGTLQIKVQVVAPDRFLTPELSAKVDFFSQKSDRVK